MTRRPPKPKGLYTLGKFRKIEVLPPAPQVERCPFCDAEKVVEGNRFICRICDRRAA